MGQYWDGVIGAWEATAYGEGGKEADFIERIAGRLRGHIVARRRTCFDRLREWISGKVALEIGCGSGATCFRLLELGAKKVYGLDISETAVRAARARASDAGIGADRACFLVHEIGASLELDEPIDIVIGLGILEYARPVDVQTFIRQVAPGSIFFSYDEKTCNLQKLLHFFYRRLKRIPFYKKYTPAEIRGLFGEAGFQKTETFREAKNAFVWQLEEA
jgi:2-polyprenyl-3-methyl-5-hydroxy-6-metoxy-1,4-benzoquinol methylase